MCLCACQNKIAVERSDEVQKGETRHLGEDLSFLSIFHSILVPAPAIDKIHSPPFFDLTTDHQSILPTSRIDVAFLFFHKVDR